MMPHTGFYKLDRTCIQSYSSRVLKEIGIEYQSEEWTNFMNTLHVGAPRGQLRPVCLRASYDEAVFGLPESLAIEFMARMVLYVNEAESVAFQCEDGK